MATAMRSLVFLSFLTVQLVLTASADDSRKTQSSSMSSNQCPELPSGTKDALVREVGLLLSTMRSAEREFKPGSDNDGDKEAVDRERLADRIAGIYSGWTSEILTYEEDCSEKIEDGIVSGFALSCGVHVNRYGWSPSGTEGVREGVKLVGNWKKRIMDEYREKLSARLDGQGTLPQEAPVGVIHVADLPSLEALLYISAILNQGGE